MIPNKLMLILAVVFGIGGCADKPVPANVELILNSAGNTLCGKEGSAWAFESGNKWRSGSIGLTIGFKCVGGKWKVGEFSLRAEEPSVERTDRLIEAFRFAMTPREEGK